MWKALKGIPKGWCEKFLKLGSTSTTATRENATHPSADSIVSARLEHYRQIPHFYFTDKPSPEDASNCQSMLPTFVDPNKRKVACQPRIFAERNGFHFSNNFFEFLGLGFVVAAGLKYCRSGYLQHDDNNEAKENGYSGFASILLGMACAMPRTGLQRTVLPVGYLPTASSSSVSTNNETDSSDCDVDETSSSHSSQSSSACSSNDDDFVYLRELASDYAANELNEEALQLLQGNKSKQAVKLLKQACRLGLDKAMFNLGICYEKGQGVEQNLLKAHRFYKRAADLGHTNATYNLAVFYLEGKGVVENKREGLKYMEKASKKGLKEAQTFLGIHYGQKQDYKNAVMQFEKAVKQKHSDAEYYLGVCYENGLGVDDDLSKAIEFYTRSAEAGNADACYSLALYYENGIGGLPQDKEHAKELYYKAASSGHPLAIKMLEWSLQEKKESKETLLKKRQSIRTVSSLPDLPSLDRSPKVANVVQKRITSSSMINITKFTELLIDMWKSKPSPKCSTFQLESEECMNATFVS